MKLCCKPGCKSARAFYNTPHHLEVCLSCRLTYYSDISFLKIPDCSLSIQTLDSISLWLSAIRNHSQSFAIEDIFKGFDGELRAFEELTSELRRRLKQAGEQDLFEEININIWYSECFIAYFYSLEIYNISIWVIEVIILAIWLILM